MGTRGTFGFYYKGKYYMIYNHFDSYALYDDLKREIIIAILNGTFDTWASRVENLICVDESIPPTDEEIEKLKKYCRYGSSYHNDWHYLLNECQGSYERVLDAGYYISHLINDEPAFIHDTIFMEYSCVLDFDKRTFRAYEFDKLVSEESIDSFYPKELNIETDEMCPNCLDNHDDDDNENQMLKLACDHIICNNCYLKTLKCVFDCKQ